MLLSFFYSYNKLLKENGILPPVVSSLTNTLSYFLKKDSIDFVDAQDLSFRVYLEYLKDKNNPHLKKVFFLSKKMADERDITSLNVLFFNLKNEILCN